MPPIRMIACHYANRSGRGQAACFLPLQAIEDMVEAGLAVWNKRRTYVNFTRSEAELHRAAQSIRMGLRVMDGYVEGIWYFVSLVNAWEGMRAA